MKRITVLKRKMKKKLTVRTLSFIMAAGLLLLVVPFVAIASGREDPEPGKKGDFRLLRDFYAVTQITLEENMETAPVVTAEISNAASYQWQAYSREREQYVDLSGKASQQMELTEALAKQYDYGNGRSYFRCLATDAEGSILISDVLTVVLPVAPTEASQTEETSATTSTIDIGEPTQPGETEPTEAVESTTAPTEETTAPTEETTAPAEETTAPTTAPTQPTEEDSDPPKGSLVIPDAEEDEDVPLRGMLLVPQRAVETTYTVNYYIQKPEYSAGDDNTSNYTLYSSESLTGTVGDTVSVTPSKPDVDFKDYIDYYAGLSKTTAELSADGTSSINIFYTRKTYTLKFNNTSGSTVVIKDKYNNTHRIRTNGSYEFNAKYGENLIGLWPTNDMFTTLPVAFFGYYYYESATEEDMWFGGNTYYNPPQKLDSEFLSASHKQTYDMNFNFYIFQTPCSLSFYFQNEDGTYNDSPDFVKRGDNTIYNDLPSYSGFSSGTPTPNSGSARKVYYSRNKYTLRYNANGGTVSPTSEQVYFDKVLSSRDYNLTPTRDGYIFQGWFYDEGFNKPVGWDVDKMPAHNLDIYAKWTVNQYPLTIHYNNGTADSTTQVDYGTSLSSYKPGTDPTKEGHTFGGWYSDSSCTQAMDWSTTMPITSYDVYAKWRIKEYTVRFFEKESDTSTYCADLIVSHGDTIRGDNYKPTRDGFVLKGWAYKDSENVQHDFIMDETPVTQDLDLYGVWNELFTVTFDPANGSNKTKLTVENGEKVSSSAVTTPPVYEDHTFLGWFYEGADGTEQEFEFDATVITGNMTVTAHWRKNEVTLIIHNTGANNIFTVSKEGLSLKVFIPAGGSATVKHLPFGDYTVAPSSPILKNWDYRFNPVANQTFTASVSDFDIPIEKTFGSGESRNLNWLGSESYKTFRPSIGG